MDLPGAALLFASNALWRATGLEAVGRTLVRALGSPHEDLRTIAGMFLVKAGTKASPLLREPLRRRENLPLVLSIIGDIGDAEFEPELRHLTEDPNPDVARAARDALDVIRLAALSSSEGSGKS
jgi:hypothetical protein